MSCESVLKRLRKNSLTILSLTVFVWSGIVFAHAPLSAPELERLAALASDSIPEINRARQVAHAFNARVALYGGTSRELINFVKSQCEEFGKEEFERRLRAGEDIDIINWHKINSDLDVMIIPDEGSGQLTSERRKVLADLKVQIVNEFPGNTLYKKMDVTISTDFLGKDFPPQLEHFEAASNIPISDRGVERLNELEVDVPGRGKVNLADWGLQQFAIGEFDFVRNPRFKDKKPGFAKFRQLLRWIRYPGENPSMKLSEGSAQEMLALAKEVFSSHKAEITKILSSRDGSGEKTRLLEAIEKLQLYSKDPEYTRKLLEKFKVRDFLVSSGLEKRHLLKPLTERAAHAKGVKLGVSGIKVYHHTHLAAAQSISDGALWMSDGVSSIGGQETAAAFGKGLYTATEHASAGYGTFFVEIELNPDAILGIDYEVSDWGSGKKMYLLKTKNAIVRNENGSLKINKINRESMIHYFLDQLKNPRAKKSEVYRGLIALINPEEGGRDFAIFKEILSRNKSNDALRMIYDIYDSKPHLARYFLLHPKAPTPELQSIWSMYWTNIAGGYSDTAAVENFWKAVVQAPDLREAVLALPKHIRILTAKIASRAHMYSLNDVIHAFGVEKHRLQILQSQSLGDAVAQVETIFPPLSETEKQQFLRSALDRLNGRGGWADKRDNVWLFLERYLGEMGPEERELFWKSLQTWAGVTDGGLYSFLARNFANTPPEHQEEIIRAVVYHFSLDHKSASDALEFISKYYGFNDPLLNIKLASRLEKDGLFSPIDGFRKSGPVVEKRVRERLKKVMNLPFRQRIARILESKRYPAVLREYSSSVWSAEMVDHGPGFAIYKIYDENKKALELKVFENRKQDAIKSAHTAIGRIEKIGPGFVAVPWIEGERGDVWYDQWHTNGASLEDGRWQKLKDLISQLQKKNVSIADLRPGDFVYSGSHWVFDSLRTRPGRIVPSGPWLDAVGLSPTIQSRSPSACFKSALKKALGRFATD